jgi:hypothetical protein
MVTIYGAIDALQAGAMPRPCVSEVWLDDLMPGTRKLKQKSLQNLKNIRLHVFKQSNQNGKHAAASLDA